MASEQLDLFDEAGEVTHRQIDPARARGLFYARCSCGWHSLGFSRAHWKDFYWRVHMRNTPRMRKACDIVRQLGRFGDA